MPLTDHLLKNEKVLADAKSPNGTLYATNRRVINYIRSKDFEKVESLTYSHIVTASYEKYTYRGNAYVGVALWIIGLIALALLYSVMGGEIGGSMIIGIIAVIFFFGGLWMVLNGFRNSIEEFYQINAIDLAETEKKVWRTKSADASSKNFAQAVQEQISNRELPNPASSQKN